MNIVFSQEAEFDIVDIAHYISENNPALVTKLFDEVWYTCELLASMPEMGTPVEPLLDSSELGEEIQEILSAKPLLTGMRRFPVKKFRKLLVFYNINEGDLQVERVLHGHRDIPVIFASMLT